MIGGHVDAEESPEDAIRRELREELGIDARLNAPFSVLDDTELQLKLTIWRITSWTGDITNCSPAEHSHLAWFEADAVSTLPFPHPAYPKLINQVLSDIDGASATT
jgi:8-oxo-dGTP pyrophosphatase MutT (NUDIX family)